MSEWTRHTPWRQGHILTDESVKKIDLIHPEYGDETIVIVASHDCDLAQLPEREPYVEVVVGHRIKTLDGNYTHAKSSKTLHIEFVGDELLLTEFVITEKRTIHKNLLVDFNPANNSQLTPSGHSTFQLWLASRYRRSAFPDEFEQRLTKAKLDNKIAKAVKPHGKMITALFFDVDEGLEVAHTSPDDIYVLDIILLHATEPDSGAAESATLKAKSEIENAFRKKLFNKESGTWQQIELRHCDVISEEALTYRESQILKKWRLDQISLRSAPQQPLSAD